MSFVSSSTFSTPSLLLAFIPCLLHFLLPVSSRYASLLSMSSLSFSSLFSSLKFFFSFPSTMFRFALVFRIILIAPSFVSESDVVADDSGILHHQRKNHEINSLVSITLPSCLIMSFGEPSVCLFVSDITWR